MPPFETRVEMMPWAGDVLKIVGAETCMHFFY